MSPFPLFETIRIQDGEICQLDFHQARVNFAFEHYFHHAPTLDLRALISVPPECQSGLFRARFEYSAQHFQCHFFPYSRRNITHFHCVQAQNVDYRFKYNDRRALNALAAPYLNDPTQEIIIVNNGWISDTSIGNLIFFNARGAFSPAHYLLKGTQLSALLEAKKVQLSPINEADLDNFTHFTYINAMNPLDLNRLIPLTPQTILRSRSQN